MAVKEVVTTSYALIVGVSDGRQLTFQSGYAEDESDEAVNARIDRQLRIADRLRARYEIPELEAEHRKLRDEQAQFEEDREKTEAAFQTAQAGLKVQADYLTGERERILTAGEAAFRAGSRQGTYTPRGSDKANVDRMEASLKQITDDVAKNEAEKVQAIENLLISGRRRAARIAIIEEQLREKRALAGGQGDGASGSTDR